MQNSVCAPFLAVLLLLLAFSVEVAEATRRPRALLQLSPPITDYAVVDGDYGDYNAGATADGDYIPYYASSPGDYTPDGDYIYSPPPFLPEPVLPKPAVTAEPLVDPNFSAFVPPAAAEPPLALIEPAPIVVDSPPPVVNPLPPSSPPPPPLPASGKTLSIGAIIGIALGGTFRSFV
jgi:hypothetical protein